MFSQLARTLSLLPRYCGTHSVTLSLSLMLILHLRHNLQDHSVNLQDRSISYFGTMALPHSQPLVLTLSHSCWYCVLGITCEIAQSPILVLWPWLSDTFYPHVIICVFIYMFYWYIFIYAHTFSPIHSHPYLMNRNIWFFFSFTLMSSKSGRLQSSILCYGAAKVTKLWSTAEVAHLISEPLRLNVIASERCHSEQTPIMYNS